MMKKLGIVFTTAGIMALALGASLTYAWFTSVSAPVGLTVNTAKISITQNETVITEDLTNKLPSEEFGYVEWPFYNESTRESVVRFSIRATAITDKNENELERSDLLLALLNDPDNINIMGIESNNNRVYVDEITGDRYIWLNANDQLDDGAFSITMTVPKELGGNYMENDVFIEDIPIEQEAVITLETSAHAVQGTYEAIEEIFGVDIADEFLGLYN